MAQPDFTNLAAATLDSRTAALDTDPGPADPTDFDNLRGRLAAVRDKLPPLYRTTFHDPYVNTLNQLGRAGFTDILLDDPTRESTGGLLMDSAHAILQNGEGFESKAIDAFQEVVSDLYDGFLSEEDRRGVEPPDKGVIPPLVKFGAPDFGPYTWPIDATSSLGCEAGIVSLPPSHARSGLLGWATLGHETAGHDILGADTGLKAELAAAVRAGVMAAVNRQALARYWSSRIDETASDVLGILNMGPAAGIGLIGYFRGLGNGKLRSDGPANDPHPADIVRGFLAAETVRLLDFSDAGAWASAIEAETMRDVQTIRLAGITVTVAQAKSMAKAVAKAIVETPMASLEQTALGEIQNWHDSDEETVASLRDNLRNPGPLAANLSGGFFAAHVVAAAVTLSIAEGNVATVQTRMIGLLKKMHDSNPAWGPLFIRHPGNIKRHRTYVPQAAEAPAPVAKSRAARAGR